MGSVLTWSIVLIALLLAAFFAISLMKKRLVQQDPTTGGGFTLSDLRQLHRDGQMTDEEFEKAKQIIVKAAQKVRETPKAPLPKAPLAEFPPQPAPGVDEKKEEQTG